MNHQIMNDIGVGSSWNKRPTSCSMESPMPASWFPVSPKMTKRPTLEKSNLQNLFGTQGLALKIFNVQGRIAKRFFDQTVQAFGQTSRRGLDMNRCRNC